MDKMTTWIDNATKFFHECESAKGWDNCKQYVADDAEFTCQSKGFADVKTIEEYCTQTTEAVDSMFRGGADYELEEITHNDKGTVSFLGTSTVKHTGPGGPVAPNGKVASIHFVYFISPDKNGKIARMTKVFDEGQARRQLEWPDA